MERSAGIIMVCNGRFLLLKHHFKSVYWGFAKGHIEMDETPEQAALREVREETGLDVRLIRGFEEKINWFFTKDGKTVYKEVVFFLGTADSEKVVLSDEHEAFVWLPFGEALKKVKHSNDKKILTMANDFLERLNEEF